MKHLLIILSALLCNAGRVSAQSAAYKPDDQQLYNTIAHLDSVFFGYYNTCDVNLDKYAAFYSDSVEFFHDTGGFMDSKNEIVEGTRKYVCGHTTRILVPGSIEVYPIKNYGAVEMGMHSFHNSLEPNAPSHPSKFVVIWKQEKEGWKIKKVISLH
jgi:ketosteroid isomerase-like protein